MSLKEGQLFLGLKALKVASNDLQFQESFGPQLSRVLEQVKADLESVQEALEHVKTDTLGDRLKYTLLKGRSRQRLLSRSGSLEKSCARLTDLCLQLYIAKSLQSSHLLTEENFVLYYESFHHDPRISLPNSDILTATGNYLNNGTRTKGMFILETIGRLAGDVRFLCAKLTSDRLSGCTGVQPVVGYRQHGDRPDRGLAELVFKFPHGTHHESLANAISSHAPPDVSRRLELCLELAHALETVHSLNMVHKAIRPRAILLVKSLTADQPPTHRLYLQDWASARDIMRPSRGLGEDFRAKGVYQHPERQGGCVDTDYEQKHDIYSVGICMLEILLWTPFVTVRCGSAVAANLRTCDLFGGSALSYRGRVPENSVSTCERAMEIARLNLNDDELVRLVLDRLEPGFQSAKEVVRSLEDLIAARA